ncbi:MAG: hypothetical protein LBO20_01070 [Bifidobacteriaceae bacterium]|jgi:hypothetical protein|nr:hypothetical protein [Bifidobacteriaceae bacterium]
MISDDVRRSDFAQQVTEKALACFGGPRGESGAPLPDSVERFHEALCAFYLKHQSDPGAFGTVDDAVNWVFGVFGNLGRWAGADAEPSFSALGLEADSIPDSKDPPSPVDAAAPASPRDPGEVIVDFFFTRPAPVSGRLSLSRDQIAIVQWRAEFTAVKPGDRARRMSTADWARIAAELDLTPRSAQVLYRRAQLAFAMIYYVIGALGPVGALASTEALGQAIAAFRKGFSGQRVWSVLRFAAESAVPAGGAARVDADRYSAAVNARPDQAARLGVGPGGPEPTEALDAFEHQVARFFGRQEPGCVLAGAPHQPIAIPPAAADQAIRPVPRT